MSAGFEGAVAAAAGCGDLRPGTFLNALSETRPLYHFGSQCSFDWNFTVIFASNSSTHAFALRTTPCHPSAAIDWVLPLESSFSKDHALHYCGSTHKSPSSPRSRTYPMALYQGTHAFCSVMD